MATKVELREKLENLERRQIELQSEKKRISKDYNEQIREVRDEIQEILELIDEINSVNE